MKPIRRSQLFEKHFKKRVSPHIKRVNQFEERLRLFMAGERGYPLHDHQLTGKLADLRSFSVAGDMSVIYEELDDAYMFLDIGTHSQVYGG